MCVNESWTNDRIVTNYVRAAELLHGFYIRFYMGFTLGFTWVFHWVLHGFYFRFYMEKHQK